ncbi:thioesterase domain-containing protein [Kitasatospora sp. NBC_01250]|uniref:thioesterase II family protein n=1 Tax=unclassified Kitasatospora TaxID=2633591 RepID=UPI002E15BBF1|nr:MULTISPECIES: alpha/beta fold hydrolase [unclassified Kitasatospora]WSJ65535.1 thioesterase domain-containing protein [Kitasatospora sp. NBC_01302]
MTSTLLLCFPHAGAGPSFFVPWRSLAPAGLEVAPVALPGREQRLGEPPFEQVADVVADVLPWIRERAAAHRGVALFGHALGAVLAFEVAGRLAAEGGPTPCGLFVSGSAGPASRPGPVATGLPDAEFLDLVAHAEGYRRPAFDNPALREALLPVLRADIGMHERYRPAPRRRLDVPITAIRGSHDQVIGTERLTEWRDHTSADFRCACLPGGHMYLLDFPAALLGLIDGRLHHTITPAR